MQRVPSLKLLLGFEAAARLGNFSRAADELCLSQSAISHQVQQLEEQIGQPLFRRVGRGVELTVAGKVLQLSVARSLDTLRSGLGRIGTYLDPGLVVVVCPAPVAQGWLQHRLDALASQLPALCPLLSTDETARYVDEVDVDITISYRPIFQAGLLELPILQDQWLTVASSTLASQLAAEPLARHPDLTGLLCLEADLTGDQTGRVFREQLNGFRKHAIYDDPRLLLDAAYRGRGIACLPRLLADEGLSSGRLQVLADYPQLPGQQLWISRVAGETRSPLVTQLFDWLLQQGMDFPSPSTRPLDDQGDSSTSASQ